LLCREWTFDCPDGGEQPNSISLVYGWGVLQPACGARTSSDRDRSQAARQRPRELHGFHRAAPVRAVAVVTWGSDSGDVGGKIQLREQTKRFPGSASRAVFLPVESFSPSAGSQDSRPAKTLQ
jgi:hypothetical protein